MTRNTVFFLTAFHLAVTTAMVGQSPSPGACVPATLPPAASAGPSSALHGELTVFAAASLTIPFEALQAPWEAAHPGSSLALSFDSSSTLRAQIEQGAPVDVFAAADFRNPQVLVDACLALGPISPFAANELVIVVPTGNPAAVTTALDLARPGLRVVAAGPDVPISGYTGRVIEQLALLPDAPADFAAAVAANTVSEEDNVRAVLAKIELGEGDAAIVYITDAVASAAVETVEIPGDANVVAGYAAVAVADTDQPALAAGFLDFLVGPEAQAVLTSSGFLPQPLP